MSVNKVIIVGRLGKDPEVRDSAGGVKICKFTVATERPGNVAPGERRETDWHNVVTFGKRAEVCEKYLSKGRQVYVEGRIEYSKSEKDGETKYFTNIVADNVEFLGDSGQGSASDRQPAASSPAPARQTRQVVEVPDDDIPF